MWLILTDKPDRRYISAYHKKGEANEAFHNLLHEHSEDPHTCMRLVYADPREFKEITKIIIENLVV